MGAADLRDLVLTRQRELASRHDVLGRAGRDPTRYEDFLLRVFDATNDLMRDLDRMRARSARRRRVVAAVLLVPGVVPAVLVATGRIPVYGLIPAAVLLVAAVVLWAAAGAGLPDRAEAGTRSGAQDVVARDVPPDAAADPAPKNDEAGLDASTARKSAGVRDVTADSDIPLPRSATPTAGAGRTANGRAGRPAGGSAPRAAGFTAAGVARTTDGNAPQPATPAPAAEPARPGQAELIAMTPPRTERAEMPQDHPEAGA